MNPDQKPKIHPFWATAWGLFILAASTLELLVGWSLIDPDFALDYKLLYCLILGQFFIQEGIGIAFKTSFADTLSQFLWLFGNSKLARVCLSTSFALGIGMRFSTMPWVLAEDLDLLIWGIPWLFGFGSLGLWLFLFFHIGWGGKKG
ncbi:MAG: hypothetical protein OXI59_18635 [Gemmatimonadota bacterium]|nr:hypothetical protein [Gemmatimonadota bacterium]